MATKTIQIRRLRPTVDKWWLDRLVQRRCTHLTLSIGSASGACWWVPEARPPYKLFAGSSVRISRTEGQKRGGSTRESAKEVKLLWLGAQTNNTIFPSYNQESFSKRHYDSTKLHSLSLSGRGSSTCSVGSRVPFKPLFDIPFLSSE